MREQLEFDFGPEFSTIQVKRDDQLQDILLSVEIAIARSDYKAVGDNLRLFRSRTWDMFWGSLQSPPK
tara:strand:+ start:3483 stop:3686 length:204 start_codon:yes stop_codon:yes gene_type:complete